MTVETLRYDQFTFKASHNSIDRAADARRWSIVDQLSGTGDVVEPLLGLELDLVQAPDALEWTVQHGGDFGVGTPLPGVLETIARWSDERREPGHPVLTIHFDLKNRPGSHADFAEGLDELLLDTFGRDRIYTPARVIGEEPDLVRGARAGGWAPFLELRGKIVFCISGDGERKSAYASHDSRARLCFADFGAASKSVPSEGARVFANIQMDHTTPSSELEKWTRHPGFVVRGYCPNSAGGWRLAVDSGLNVVSTDSIGRDDLVLSGLGYSPLRNGHRQVPETLCFARARRGHHFRNWSKTVEFAPGRFVQPTTEEHIQEIVRAAGHAGSTVRAQGAGHSFSQIVTTGGTLLSLDDLDRPTGVHGTTATVPAGIRLKDLIPLLKDNGLGLANIGSVTQQSIAGAISTGTHGTGLRYASMPTQVSAVRFVDGLGNVRGVDRTEPELLGAVRLSLGMLGILTSVTLECVPYYDVEYDAYLCGYDHAVDRLVELGRENERMLLWWRLPLLPVHRAILITKNTPGQDKGLLSDAGDATDALRGTLERPALPRAGDELAKPLASIDPGRGFRRILHRKGGYENKLTLPLLPALHRELEYAVPIEHTETALRSLRNILAEGGTDLSLGCEVRFVGGDTDMLSPTRNEDVCYIGVSTLDNATEVFERIEPMFRELGGRPHWGKHFNLTRDDVEAMYGSNHDRFVELRRDFDPKGVLLNSLLRRLFA